MHCCYPLPSLRAWIMTFFLWSSFVLFFLQFLFRGCPLNYLWPWVDSRVIQQQVAGGGLPVSMCVCVFVPNHSSATKPPTWDRTKRRGHWHTRRTATDNFLLKVVFIHVALHWQDSTQHSAASTPNALKSRWQLKCVICRHSFPRNLPNLSKKLHVIVYLWMLFLTVGLFFFSCRQHTRAQKKKKKQQPHDGLIVGTEKWRSEVGGTRHECDSVSAAHTLHLSRMPSFHLNRLGFGILGREDCADYPSPQRFSGGECGGSQKMKIHVKKRWWLGIFYFIFLKKPSWKECSGCSLLHFIAHSLTFCF